MEFITGLVFAPILFTGFLLSTAWWIVGFFGVGVLVSTYLLDDIFEKEDYGFEAGPCATLFGTMLIVMFFYHWLVVDSGFISSMASALGSVLSGIVSYIVWSLPFVALLWFFDGRQFKRKYDVAMSFYNDKTFHEDEMAHRRWSESKRKARLKRDKPIDARSREGLKRIASLVFMWPIHLMHRLFGEIIKGIPELVSKYFGGLLNRIGNIATGGVSGPPPMDTSEV